MSEQSLTWPDFALGLYDKLTGRGAEITYQFENMEIFVPSHVDENPRMARWKVNGTLKIRTRDQGTAAG